jgi:hypothetical protein
MATIGPESGKTIISLSQPLTKQPANLPRRKRLLTHYRENAVFFAAIAGLRSIEIGTGAPPSPHQVWEDNQSEQQ